MSFSYSKVQCYDSCPYKYRLKYLDKLVPKPDLRPENALFIGTATHEGIEKRSVEAALESYRSNYPEITEAHEVEMLKMKTILPKAIEVIPHGEYEHKLLDNDGFIGFIDEIVPVEDGIVDLLDFKTSNNVDSYLRSGQLHVYKYYYEKLTGNKVRDLYYVFIPKYKDKLDEGMSPDDIDRLKQKIVEELSKQEINFQKVEFDRKQINFFFARKTMMDKDKLFEKRYSTKCQWCEYANYCKSNGTDKSDLLEEE